MFNLGVLYRVQQFLELINSNEITLSEFKRSYVHFNQVASIYILEAAERFRWVKIENGRIKPSVSGLAIINDGETVIRLRRQIKDMLEREPPVWISLLGRGRKALKHYATHDTLQCFEVAELLNEIDPEVAHWWDQINARGWEASQLNRMEIGRRGEWLSIEHERGRTGATPQWVALDLPFAGYDVLSLLAANSDQKLFIEVKTSERPWGEAQFHLSRNEWEVLNSKESAHLHLWCIAENTPKLSTVPITALLPHIPQDRGAGEWQDVIVPFQAVESRPGSIDIQEF